MTKLPIALRPARTAMVDATGRASNVPYCVVRICSLGKDVDSSSGGRGRIIDAPGGRGKSLGRVSEGVPLAEHPFRYNSLPRL
jgi:hypothetical protein